MSTQWVLVCDAAGAKVYTGEALEDDLTLVEEISVAHRATPGPEAVEAEADPHRIAEDRLARTVAETINMAADHHRFERLVVVAPARLLGNLRMVLSTDVQRKIVASIHHDWTHFGVRELSTHLRKELAESAVTVQP